MSSLSVAPFRLQRLCAICFVVGCGGRSIDPGDAENTGGTGPVSQTAGEAGESQDAATEGGSAGTADDSESTAAESGGDGDISEASGATDNTSSTSMDGSGETTDSISGGDGDMSTTTDATGGDGDTSTATDATGGDGDGDGDSPLECGFWESSMPGTLVIAGSQASKSCLDSFNIEGYAMPGSNSYQLVVDACPCDQDCAEPDPHTITRLDGGWIGQTYQGCIRVSASAAPVDCHSRLVTVHADENPCELVAMSFDIGDADFNAVPEVILDDPELRIENLGLQACLPTAPVSHQYLLEFSDPWQTQVHLSEGEFGVACDGGLNVHLGRITKNRVVPGDGTAWGYVSLWTGVGSITPP